VPVPVPVRSVYLDHAATTPLHPRVLEAMLPFLTRDFGNPSSLHAIGRRARFAVEESRERVAACIGAEASEIVFTSGGTEANNLAIQGILRTRRGRLVTSCAEHEAVLRPAERLQAEGRDVTLLTPSAFGAVTPEQVDEEIAGEVALVSLMHANNEVGTLSSIREVASLCRRRGVLLHCDAVQTAGLLRLDVRELGPDLLTLSAHKMYGPKGVGALYVRGGVELPGMTIGGSQERGRRGGTENVAAIVGMAEALEKAVSEADEHVARLSALRDRLAGRLREELGHRIVFNTPIGSAPVAPHIVNVAFPPRDGVRVDGEMLLLGLDLEGVCVSAGSACTSGALEPSHVLLALGRDRPTASAALRFSLGADNTEEDVDYAVERLCVVAKRTMED
jgi:cysteine desulfurase